MRKHQLNELVVALDVLGGAQCPSHRKVRSEGISKFLRSKTSRFGCEPGGDEYCVTIGRGTSDREGLDRLAHVLSDFTIFLTAGDDQGR